MKSSKKMPTKKAHLVEESKGKVLDVISQIIGADVEKGRMVA